MQNLDEQLRQFLRESSFNTGGAVITDLDGTVVHETQGQIRIPVAVEAALKALYEQDHSLVLNTLRFPLSVIRTLGREWYGLARHPIPLVTLNGSQTGWITMVNGELVFEEIAGFPLTAAEIEEILIGISGLLTSGVRDILVFYYPRDWRIGEVVWTPVAEKVPQVKLKYSSASAVTAVTFDKLHQQLVQEEISMIFLLVDIPHDKLMAYQHTRRSNFFTHTGVDKQSGARQIAAHLGVNLADSVGAGDTEMDVFLKDVGLALMVGNASLPFRGVRCTIKLQTLVELGAVLFRLAELRGEAAR